MRFENFVRFNSFKEEICRIWAIVVSDFYYFKERLEVKKYHRASLGRCLLAGLLLLLLQGRALAASEWFTCKVELAGPSKNYSFVTLTDQAEPPAFVSKWFILQPDKSKEMLAVALMAISTGKQVVVVVDPEAGNYPEISDIFLQAGQ